ncbi:uncharacterized protein LOC129565890 isoform X3 [Sitodiplosis mosellana]|uniref:uncharacterized protein LOC129565890 isoform X3 n=1 Tax=Sitodiplosis mosellana TaxID=263140 RepID=UPI00244437F9|nr:uncharacterized protein LOC129565890 isoform X3 [Sitodiplosis mosellana]
MLSFVVLVMFAATVANAGFHKHRYFTTDMNGFHNFGRHYGFGQHGRFGPPPPVYGPPPPVYGPPPPFVPQFHQALIDHRSTTTPSIIDANNGGNQPQNPYIPPNQTKGSPDATGSSTDANQNNGNNYNGTGAIATDNDFDSVDEPSAATTTTTPSPAQGKYNGLDYDIDVRFSDSKNDNRTNQKPLDTIKP